MHVYHLFNTYKHRARYVHDDDFFAGEGIGGVSIGGAEIALRRAAVVAVEGALFPLRRLVEPECELNIRLC